MTPTGVIPKIFLGLLLRETAEMQREREIDY